MLLPQKPYIPIGSLRAALAYPGAPELYDEATLRSTLDAVPAWLSGRQARCRGRLAAAIVRRRAAAVCRSRALFWRSRTGYFSMRRRRRWTSRWKPASIRLCAKDSQTTIVSIGHRQTIEQYHERRARNAAVGAHVCAPKDNVGKAAESKVRSPMRFRSHRICPKTAAHFSVRCSMQAAPRAFRKACSSRRTHSRAVVDADFRRALRQKPIGKCRNFIFAGSRSVSHPSARWRRGRAEKRTSAWAKSSTSAWTMRAETSRVVRGFLPPRSARE